MNELMINISKQQTLNIVYAIAFILLFNLFSGTISKVIINLCKINSKSKKQARENAFYKPIIILNKFIGVYIGIYILKTTFDVTDEIMNIFNKIFIIVLTIAFAKALMKSFTMESSIVKKYRRNSKKEIKESMLEFILKSIRVIIAITAGVIVMNTLRNRCNITYCRIRSN